MGERRTTAEERANAIGRLCASNLPLTPDQDETMRFVQDLDDAERELAEARAQIDEMGQEWNRHCVTNAGLQGEAQRARAEVERLRGVVKTTGGDFAVPWAHWTASRYLAIERRLREALTTQPDSDAGASMRGPNGECQHCGETDCRCHENDGSPIV